MNAVVERQTNAVAPTDLELYWQKLLRAVHEKILPGIEIPAVEDELSRNPANYDAAVDERMQEQQP